MKSTRWQVAVAFVLWASIYALSLYLLPALAPVRALRQQLPWLGSGDVTQFFFLLFSMTAMLTIAPRRLIDFGFRRVKLAQLLKPIWVTAVIELGLLIVAMITMSIIMGGPGASDGEGGKHPAMDKSVIGMIISVWIVASSCEEILYRGLLQSLLEPLARWGLRLRSIQLSLPVLISGLLFGLGHLCLARVMSGLFLAQIIVSTTIVGLIAGYYRSKTGSLAPAIAVHVTANIVGMAIPMLMMNLMGQ